MGVRISEIYASVQGEGPRTGMGTVFLRFGGCNLRCPGWPCDSLFAVLPEFRTEWTRRSARQALEDTIDACRDSGTANVCLTGGEPFIQNNDALKFIVQGLLTHDISVEAFSNGQVRYPDWAFDLVSFIMDWKLPGSGNPADANPDLLALMRSNVQRLKPDDAIKFVIMDNDDFNHATKVWEEEEPHTLAQWWAGVVWEGDLKESELVDMILSEKLPWNLNVQMHKYIWTADKRGV